MSLYYCVKISKTFDQIQSIAKLTSNVWFGWWSGDSGAPFDGKFNVKYTPQVDHKNHVRMLTMTFILDKQGQD